jgi:hypothetical protein
MRAEKNAYMTPGWLEDVLALIQVLGLGQSSHPFEARLIAALDRKPDKHSGEAKWVHLARKHPEFFRVHTGSNLEQGESVSLISRHVGRDENGERIVSADFVQKLLGTAIEIHDRQLRRREQCLQIGSLLFAGVASLASFITVVWNVFLHKS